MPFGAALRPMKTARIRAIKTRRGSIADTISNLTLKLLETEKADGIAFMICISAAMYVMAHVVIFIVR